MGTPAESYRTFFLVNSIDPTRTITTRHRFVADVRRRFKQLVRDIYEAVVVLDVFGLNDDSRIQINASGLEYNQFASLRSDQQIESFVSWLHDKNEEYLLSGGARGIRTIGSIATGTDARASWMSTYLSSSYQQGIRRARQEMRKIGVDIDEGLLGGDPINVAFNGPMHTDRVGLVYTRAYSSLKGITAAMESTVADVLAMGMADGMGPREIARLLDKAITGKGGTLELTDRLGRFMPSKRRAEILARTEVIRAHHAANIAEYEAAGMMGIEIMAEHLTAGDRRVCPICAPLNGRRYTLKEARYVIPVHPQCRCIALPFIPED